MLERVVHVLILVAMTGVMLLVGHGGLRVPVDPPSWLGNPYPVQVDR